MYYVYILKGENKHYVGITDNLDKRLNEHRTGRTQTTKTMGNLQLVKYYSFPTRQEAASHEKKIKQSGHIERWI